MKHEPKGPKQEGDTLHCLERYVQGVVQGRLLDVFPEGLVETPGDAKEYD